MVLQIFVTDYWKKMLHQLWMLLADSRDVSQKIIEGIKSEVHKGIVTISMKLRECFLKYKFEGQCKVLK